MFGDVILDRALGEIEPVGDFLVRGAASEQEDDSALRGERDRTKASAFGPPESNKRAKAATTRPVTVFCSTDSPRVVA